MPSYPGFLDTMITPGMQYMSDAVVRDGKILTSYEPGAAMDFALALIETLSGKEKRDQIVAGLVRSASWVVRRLVC